MRHFNVFVKEKGYKHFMRLTKNLRYIKKTELDTRPTKKQITKNLKEGLTELGLIEKSKLKTTSLITFLNEL